MVAAVVFSAAPLFGQNQGSSVPSASGIPATANPALGPNPSGGQPSAPAATSSPATDPPWLLLDKGKLAYRDGRFGTALQYFRAAVAAGGETPETDMWIGRVFEEEGEIDLAEIQYERALANKNQFLIPDEYIEILYDLAAIYRNTNSYGKYKVTLNEIVAKDSFFTSEKESATRTAMVKLLESQGLDRLLLLYRLTDKMTQRAHSDLGSFDYQTGRYDEAILNLIFSTVTIFTTIIDRYQVDDPAWQFTTVSELFTLAKTHPAVSRYLPQSGIFRDLYYLAAALYANGFPQRASQLWRLVTTWSPHDTWYLRSVDQLANPTIEPVLIPSD